MVELEAEPLSPFLLVVVLAPPVVLLALSPVGVGGVMLVVHVQANRQREWYERVSGRDGGALLLGATAPRVVVACVLQTLQASAADHTCCLWWHTRVCLVLLCGQQPAQETDSGNQKFACWETHLSRWPQPVSSRCWPMSLRLHVRDKGEHLETDYACRHGLLSSPAPSFFVIAGPPLAAAAPPDPGGLRGLQPHT